MTVLRIYRPPKSTLTYNAHLTDKHDDDNSRFVELQPRRLHVYLYHRSRNDMAQFVSLVGRLIAILLSTNDEAYRRVWLFSETAKLYV